MKTRSGIFWRDQGGQRRYYARLNGVRLALCLPGSKSAVTDEATAQALYAPDLRPLSPKNLQRALLWLEWSRADLLALVEGIDDRRLRAKPERGRSLYDILKHIGEAEPHYITGVLGRVKDLTAAGNAIYHERIEIRDGLRDERAALIERLRGLTAEERRLVQRPPGRVRTIRRAITIKLATEIRINPICRYWAGSFIAWSPFLVRDKGYAKLHHVASKFLQIDGGAQEHQLLRLDDSKSLFGQRDTEDDGGNTCEFFCLMQQIVERQAIYVGEMILQ